MGSGFGDLVERVGDCRVVGGGGGEGLLSEPPASLAAQSAPFVGFQFFDESGIIGGRGHDGDIFEVLGGGADHGGAADIDVFDEVAEGNAGLRRGLLERVEVDDDHVDGLNLMRGDGGFVFRVAANVKEPAMDPRVQRLYAAVEHLGKAGEIADVLYCQARPRAERERCRRWRPVQRRSLPELWRINEARFVGHAEQRPADRFCCACRSSHSSTP